MFCLYADKFLLLNLCPLEWSALGEAAMSNEQARDYDPPAPKHPVCPTCGVPMWLTLIERAPGSTPMKDRLICQFENGSRCDVKF
jgi:hypothetical protein